MRKDDVNKAGSLAVAAAMASTVTVGGAQTVIAGAGQVVEVFGNDTVFGADGPATIAVGTGAMAYVIGSTGPLLVGGGGGSVTVLGGSGGGVFIGGSSGSNLLNGATGSSTLAGGGGNDTLIGGVSDVIFTGSGSETIAYGSADTIVGSSDPASSALYEPSSTGGQQSLIFLGAGIATLNAQAGDTIVSGVGAATINGTGFLLFAKSGTYLNPALFVSSIAGPASTIVGLTGGSTLIGGAGGDLVFDGAAGHDRIRVNGPNATVVASGPADTIESLASRALIFGGPGSPISTFNDGPPGYPSPSFGGSTIVGGSGQATLIIERQYNAIFPGPGSSMVLLGLEGTGDTVFAAQGSVTVDGYRASSDLIYAGLGGNSLLIANAGQQRADTLVGMAAGDTLQALSGNVLIAGGGAEVLDVSGARGGQTTLYAGSGNDTLIDVPLAGQRTPGTTIFSIFENGRVGGADVIQNFDPGQDMVVLQGYGPNAAQQAVQSAVSGNAGTVVTLPDQTTITFAATSSVAASFFMVR